MQCTMYNGRSQSSCTHTHTHMVCCIQLPLYIMHSTLACCHPAWSQLGEQSNWQPTRGDDSSDPRNRNEAHDKGCLPTDHWFRCQDLTSWSAAGHASYAHSQHFEATLFNRYSLILTRSLARSVQLSSSLIQAMTTQVCILVCHFLRWFDLLQNYCNLFYL